MTRLRVIPPLDLPSRRDVLKWIGVGAAAAALPGCHPKPAEAPVLRFFTPAEATAMGALANGIIPPDSAPGGQALGAVIYIDHFLSAFDAAAPEILAGGPFSGRAPYPNADGTPSSSKPPDSFATFYPLDRIAQASWKLYLYGSDAVGGGPNDAVIGKTIGLRDQVRNGLAAIVSGAKVPLETQTVPEMTTTLQAVDPDFLTTLIQLVSQGCLAAPEYGGNVGTAGWQFCHYEGDQQPFGFTQYDATTGLYRERADAPTSTANPGADPDPMDQDTITIINTAIAFLGGTAFS